MLLNFDELLSLNPIRIIEWGEGYILNAHLSGHVAGHCVHEFCCHPGHEIGGPSVPRGATDDAPIEQRRDEFRLGFCCYRDRVKASISNVAFYSERVNGFILRSMYAKNSIGKASAADLPVVVWPDCRGDVLQWNCILREEHNTHNMSVCVNNVWRARLCFGCDRKESGLI